MTDVTEIPGLDDKERLKKFCLEGDIHFVVFSAQTLIDALTLDEVEVLQHIIVKYTQHCHAVGVDPTDEDWLLRASAPPGGAQVLLDAIPGLHKVHKQRQEQSAKAKVHGLGGQGRV